MAADANKKENQLMIALTDLSKRIPVVKLERLKEKYPILQKVVQKPVDACNTNEKEKEKEGSVAHKDIERKIKDDTDNNFGVMFPENCRENHFSTSEPPKKKQYKVKVEDMRNDNILSETNKSCVTEIVNSSNETGLLSTLKPEVVFVENSPNSPIAFRRNSEPNEDPLTLPINSESETYSQDDTSGLYSQISKMEKSEVYSEHIGTGIQVPTYSGNTKCRPIATLQSKNTSSRTFLPRISDNSTSSSYCENGSLPYSRNNQSGANILTYSASGGILNTSAINVPVAIINVPIFNANNIPAVNSPVYIGSNVPQVSALTYSGTSGSGVQSVSFSGFNRPPSLNLPTCSGGNAPIGTNRTILPVYSGNNVSGINSLTYSGNNGSIVMPSVYYSNDGTALTPPQTYSGSNNCGINSSYVGNNRPRINTQTYSGNAGSGVNAQPYSGLTAPTVNSLTYHGSKSNGINSSCSNNTLIAVNSSVYSENSGLGVNSSSYTGNNRHRINTPTYPGNGGVGINSSSYPGDNRPRANSTSYSESNAAGINPPVYSINSGYGPNVSGYSGNSGNGDFSGDSRTGGNQACKEIQFAGNASAQQYGGMQNYCTNSESRIENMNSQETIWSNDYITLTNLPVGGYQVVESVNHDFQYVFTCRVCGNTSSTIQDLVKHWRQHTGVDSLTCSTCYVSFTDILFLQAHWKTLHMGSVCTDAGVLPRVESKVTSEIICEACGFAFASYPHLENHIISTHVPAGSQQKENNSWKSINNGGATYNDTVVNHHDSSLTEDIVAEPETELENNMAHDDQESSITELTTVLQKNVNRSGLSIARDDVTGTEVHRTENNAGMKTNDKIKSSSASAEVTVEISSESEDQEGDNAVVVDSVSKDSECSKKTSGRLKSFSKSIEKVFKCRYCLKAFADMKALMKHWRIHIGADSSTCTICKKTFSELPFLQAHWKRSHMVGKSVRDAVTINPSSAEKEGKETFVCDVCCFAFSNFVVLEKHFMTTHITQYSEIISRNFQSIHNANNAPSIHKKVITVNKIISKIVLPHNHSINNSNKKNLKKNVDNLETERTADEVEEPKTCDTCKSDNQHKTNPTKCIVCGEVADNIIKHLGSHTGVASLECVPCGKEFVDVPFLQAHWRATHMSAEVHYNGNGIFLGNFCKNASHSRKFLCETCGCYLPEHSALEKHIIITHSVISPPYECKCGNVFPSENNLKNHISTCKSW